MVYKAVISALLVLLAVQASVVAAAAGLGPGRGEWTVESPEKHGLSSAALEAAAKQIGVTANERYCLTVVKDGVIVHETYFSNTSASIYETDSLGKTATAALIGILVEDGLLDIDTPIREYGVPSNLAVWNASGVNYFENVTLRHILAQSSGYGTVPPGSKMTYDSDLYIQHISYTITEIVKKNLAMQGAYEYAKKKFAVPLGIPTLYDFDGTGVDISAGGGQMMSCREIAKVAQVIVNRGVWLDENDKPYQMANANYLEQMLQPAFPGVIDGYGLLTWLNTDMTKKTASGADRAHCCAPRWANGKGTTPPGVLFATCCENAPNYTAHTIPCDPQLPVLPERPCADTPQADCVKACDPSEYVVTQNLGDSFPATDKIFGQSEHIGFGMGQFAKYTYIDTERNITVSSFGQSTGHSLDCLGGYNDGYTLSLIWKALAPVFDNATTPSSEDISTPSAKAQLVGTSNRVGGDRTRESLMALTTARPSTTTNDTFVGSCTCTCPPGEGFGKCFNVPKADVVTPPANGDSCPTSVEAKLPNAYDWCPAVGYPSQCMPWQVGQNTCGTEYVMVTPCAFVGDSKTLATAGCRRLIPQAWGDHCVWSTVACQPTPFFPPPYDL
eukprot:m.259895 g.259895  ORF g.259895 m.259895 type:complete len:615 (+) comp38863_c0_seq1:70-1914(+)